MPWYREDVDLDQKQLVTVSIATTFLKQSIATGLIIVECFHPKNFVEIMALVVEL